MTAIQSPTELALVQNAIANMNAVNQGLAELASKYKGVIYDVTAPKGMADAKAARREIAGPRIEVEKIRKAAKAPILELGRKLDAEAARITKELEALETPIDTQIKTEENRVEAERQAKVKAEQERQAAILARIADIHRHVEQAQLCRTSAEIASHIVSVSSMAIGELQFGEYMQDAIQAQLSTLNRLQALHTAAKDREAESARMAEERAALDKQRAEQEAREKEQRERLAKEEAAARAKRVEEDRAAQVERDRIAAEQAAESARIRKEREALEAAQRAEQERKDREERERQEAAARDEAARQVEAERQRKANFVPTLEEVCTVLANHFDVTDERVLEWLPRLVKKSKKAA